MPAIFSSLPGWLPRTPTRRWLEMVFALLLLGISPLHAQSITWTGTTSTDWNTASNWDTNAIPGAANGALIGAAANQPLLSSGNVAVGNYTVNGANASLIVNGTGNLLSGYFIVNGSATMTIDGPAAVVGTNGTGATMFGTINWRAIVGNNTNGSLLITNGAKLFADVLVGYGTAQGNLLVDGNGSTISSPRTWAGSTLNATARGNITVSNGGAIVNSVSFFTGGDGTHVLVTGRDNSDNPSTIAVSTNISLSGANGSITIANGGRISANVGMVGSGSDNTILVTGNGSSLLLHTNGIDNTASMPFAVNLGNGTNLTVANGALFTSNQTVIGIASSSASVTVDGAGSTWNATGNLAFGFSGSAALTLSNGGLLDITNSTVTVANSTLNLNSGATLLFDTGSGMGNVSNMTFNWGGGTIKIASNNTTVIPFNATLAANTTSVIDTNGHNLTYSGSFSGAGNLTKSGSGCLTIDRQNYNGTGSINLNAGTLVFNGTRGTLNAAMALNNATATFTNGTLTMVGGVVTGLTMPGNISGNGTLNFKEGAFTLAGNNTLAGNIVVSPTNGASGFLILAGDTSQLTANISLNSTTARVTFNGAADTTFPGTISSTGSASIAIIGPGNLTLTANNAMAGFQGGLFSTGVSSSNLIITGDTAQTTHLNVLLSNGGGIVFNQPTDSSCGGSVICVTGGSFTHAGPGTLTFSGTLSYNATTTVAVGTLVVNGAISLRGNVSNNSSLILHPTVESNIPGAIAGNGSVTINGTAAMTFSGNNTYAGPTTVNGGTLLVDGSLSAASNVTVNSGGVLGGNGSIAAPVVINSGGGLAPGDNGGTLHIPTLTLAGNAASTFFINGTGNYAQLSSTAALTHAGSLTLTLGAGLNVGVYNLYSAPELSGDFSSVTLAGGFTGALTESGGVWNGATSGVNFSFNPATGQLTVTEDPLPGVPAAKQAWLERNFSLAQIADLEVTGDYAMPKSDGTPNLLKYAFDIAAYANAATNLPQPQLVGGNLVLTFTALHSELTYTVEASTDLLNWSIENVTVQTSGNQVTASYPLPGSGRAFLHVVVAPIPAP